MLKLIADFLADVEANPALRAHRDLLRDFSQSLEKRVKELEGEVSRLVKENSRLANELSACRPSDEWVKTRGILLKKNAKGGVEPDAYCEKCRCTMFAIEGGFPLRCPRCNFYTAFTADELDPIRRSAI